MSMYLDGRAAIISVAQRGKITVFSKPECVGDGKKYNMRKNAQPETITAYGRI